MCAHTDFTVKLTNEALYDICPVISALSAEQAPT